MIDLIPIQYRLAAALIGVALVAVGSAAGAWTARGWKEDAARLAAERQAQADYLKLASIYGQALNDANSQRETDRQMAAADRLAYQRRLKDATRPSAPPLALCGPGLDPAGPAADRRHVRLTPAFARLLNGALSIGLPAPLRADGDHSRGARPGPGAGN
jgi:hypothetical protein